MQLVFDFEEEEFVWWQILTYRDLWGQNTLKAASQESEG